MSELESYRARYATEQWFRQQGLPYFVDRRNRGRRLLARSAPVLVFLAAAYLGVTVLFGFRDWGFDKDSGETVTGNDLVVALFVLVLLVIPTVAASVVRRYLVRRPAWARLSSLAAIAMIVLICPLLGYSSVMVLLEEIFAGMVVVFLILGLTWLGIGSFLGWSARAAFRQLSAIWLLAAIALPLLMLVVIFAFYSVETWQMASRLPRGQMFWLLSFLAAVGLLFIVHTARKELVGMPKLLTEETRQQLREDTPLAGLKDSMETGWTELNRLEQANITIVLVLAQCFQVLIFGGLVFLFMMTLCALSIPADLVQLWTGQPNPPLELFGNQVWALRQSQVRVSAFLAGIAALNFVVSVNSSQSYRDAFYDPLILQTGRALAVQVAYQSNFVAPELPVEKARTTDRDREAQAAEQTLQKERP